MTKRVLFYAAVVVFLVISYIVSLYAQGYKYNFSERRFVRTGAIYIKTSVDADIFINDKLWGSTSFFGNSFTATGLMPGAYDVRLQKTGYFPWQKTILVEEGLISEFSKVFILPNAGDEKTKLQEEIKKTLHSEPTSSPVPSAGSTDEQPFFIKKEGLFQKVEEKKKKLADGVKGFGLSENKDKLFWWNLNEIWMLWLKDADYQPYKKVGEKELITRVSASIKAAAWFRGSDHVTIELSEPTQAKSVYYEIIELDKRGGINVVGISK